MILLFALALLLPPDRVVVSLDRSQAGPRETVTASVSLWADGPVDLEVRPSWGGVVRWEGTVNGVRTIAVPLQTPADPPYALHSVTACVADLCSVSEPLALGEAIDRPWNAVYVPIARA